MCGLKRSIRSIGTPEEDPGAERTYTLPHRCGAIKEPSGYPVADGNGVVVGGGAADGTAPISLRYYQVSLGPGHNDSKLSNIQQ